MNRKHIDICQNRNESKRACLSASAVFGSSRCNCPTSPLNPFQSEQLSGHLSQVTRTKEDLHPWDQCRSMIGSGIKSLRCQRVARSCRTWKVFVNKALICASASPRSQNTALQLVVTNDCCWVVLSLSTTHPWLFLCLQISFHWTMCYFSWLHYHFHCSHWAE